MPDTAQRVADRLERVARLETSLASLAQTADRIETELRGVRQRVDSLTASGVPRSDFERQEARLRLVEIGLVAVGGWEALGAGLL